MGLKVKGRPEACLGLQEARVEPWVGSKDAGRQREEDRAEAQRHRDNRELNARPVLGAASVPSSVSQSP